MPSRQKTKGNSFERKAASLLSVWWGDEFLRTPNSGGMRWGGKAWEYGDLTPPPGFPCVVECKHERTADHFNSILNGTRHKNTPLGWWEQANADSRRCRKDTGGVVFPLVLYKIDRQPVRLMIETHMLDATRSQITRMDVRRPECSFSVVNTDEFFESVDKEAFLHAVKATIPSFLLESA